MSGAPPPQQPNTCSECDEQKTTREITLSNLSKNTESEVEHKKGTAEFGSVAGGTDRKDSQTTGRENTSKEKSTFFICQTPGCPQRGFDLWTARKWQIEKDPKLDASPETKEWEKQQIKNREAELVEDRSDFFNNEQTDKQRENVQETDGYGTSRNGIERGSSRQSAHNSTNQSRHSQDQNTATATEWGDTPDNNATAWSNEQAAASGWDNTSENDSTAWSEGQASGTNASEQNAAEANGRGSTAGNNTTSWGNPRESDTTSKKQDSTTEMSNPSETNEETTSTTNAFEKSIYGDSETDSEGSTMANVSPKAEDSAETNTEAEAERYNNSRSRNRSR